MTDNEIIKALEICLSDLDCPKCPYVDYDGDEICSIKMLKDVIDLINRQKAEIERLQQNLKEAHIDIKEHQAEIERLKIKIEGVQEANAILREHIRKAIKEFAERLKENKIDIDVSFGYGREVYTEAVAVVEIDNLVKEMVGDD